MWSNGGPTGLKVSRRALGCDGITYPITLFLSILAGAHQTPPFSSSFYYLFSLIHSVQRSSPRTTKGPRTRLDQTDLGPDCSPGSTLVLSGLVLVLKIFWDVKDQSWTSSDQS